MDELEIRIGDLLIRLFSGVETASKRTALTIEDYILQQRAMGVSDEIILANLNDDIKTDRFGFFKAYKGELRDTVTGGLHQASSLGQFSEYAKKGKQKQFRWVAVGDKNSCRDCEERNGQEEDLETWELIGLPASGFSVCNERCRCIIEPIGVEAHGRIDTTPIKPKIDYDKIDNVMDGGEKSRNYVRSSVGLNKIKNEMKKNNLSEDESALINQYTGNYRFLNKSLRNDSGNQNVKYAKEKLNDVLDKFPNENGNVNRWIKIESEDVADFEKIYMKDSTIEFKSFLSTSKKEFIETRNGNVFYKIKSKNGKDISSFSEFPEEGEILFKAGSKFRVKNIKKISNEYGDIEFQIEMEEL